MSKPSIPALALLTLAAIAASAPATAEYEYWYYDPDSAHQAGDLTDIAAPAWACARRFLGGAELHWIGDGGAGVGPNNGGQEVNNSFDVYFGTGAGCKPRPRIE